MDALFLEYYNDDLTHLRRLAGEFADLNQEVAQNLRLNEAPCPDPYVERLLEGVAFLAARTRLKIDAETARLSRDILEMLYPDLAAPTPAVSRVVLEPGGQVRGLEHGYRVRRGTKLVSDPNEALQTRATYTTCQDVRLWPIEVRAVEYLPDPNALESRGLGGSLRGGAAAALRVEIAPLGSDPLSLYGIDSLDFTFDVLPMAGALFDAVHGFSSGVVARAKDRPRTAYATGEIPSIIGLGDEETLFPRTRRGFEGYRLLREYFVLPERFHGMRIGNLRDAVRLSTTGTLEIFVLLTKPIGEVASVKRENLLLFATPIVNLFSKECSPVQMDRRATGQVVHPDRARPQDFELYAVQTVEDLETRGGLNQEIVPAHSMRAVAGSPTAYSLERRPRRPGADERERSQFRSTYPGDDVLISLASRQPDRAPPGRLDIRALCTNRDIPILEPSPRLTVQSGDPVAGVRLLSALRRPLPSLRSGLTKEEGGPAKLVDMSWRLVAQLSLNFLSLADEGGGGEALRALLQLYADRGHADAARHTAALVGVRMSQGTERLPFAGPICFGQVTTVSLEFDDQVFSGHSRLLLGGLLSKLFTRYASLNSFIRCKTVLSRRQETVLWPMTPSMRGTI